MNWPSIIILGMIIAAVLAIIIRGIIRKKQGKSFCSCGCGGCALRETCHKK